MWRFATKARNELEIAGELSLALGGFAIPRRDGARQQRIQSRKRAFSVSRRSSGEAVINPRAGETIPAVLLESENQSAVLAQLKMLKFFA